MVTTRLSYASPPCPPRRALLTDASFPPKPNVAAAGRRSHAGARRSGCAAPAARRTSGQAWQTKARPLPSGAGVGGPRRRLQGRAGGPGRGARHLWPRSSRRSWRRRPARCPRPRRTPGCTATPARPAHPRAPPRRLGRRWRRAPGAARPPHVAEGAPRQTLASAAGDCTTALPRARRALAGRGCRAATAQASLAAVPVQAAPARGARLAALAAAAEGGQRKHARVRGRPQHIKRPAARRPQLAERVAALVGGVPEQRAAVLAGGQQQRRVRRAPGHAVHALRGRAPGVGAARAARERPGGAALADEPRTASSGAVCQAVKRGVKRGLRAAGTARGGGRGVLGGCRDGCIGTHRLPVRDALLGRQKYRLRRAAPCRGR